MKVITSTRFIVAVILLAVVSTTDSLCQTTAEQMLSAKEARFLFEAERSEARKQLTELQEKMDQALGRVGKTLQSEGNLDGLLFIKKERETFRDRVEPGPLSAIDELNSLRQIYWREREALRDEIDRGDAAALTHYRERLETIVRELTKAGHFDEALAVKTKIENAEAEISGENRIIAADTGVEIILGTEENYVIETDCQLEKNSDLYVITSEAPGGTYVASERTFKTPFHMLARAETNTTNIRFYFGQQGIVILGWEMNPSELRIVEPLDRKQNGLPGAGAVTPGEMHDIKIQVGESAITVSVDGEKRGAIIGNYTSAEGKIGIGPARGSVLTVESFRGVQE